MFLCVSSKKKNNKPKQKKTALLFCSQKKLCPVLLLLYFEVHLYYVTPDLLICLWTRLLRATLSFTREFQKLTGPSPFYHLPVSSCGD